LNYRCKTHIARVDRRLFHDNGREAFDYHSKVACRTIGSCRVAVRTNRSTKSTRAFNDQAHLPQGNESKQQAPETPRMEKANNSAPLAVNVQRLVGPFYL